MEAADHPWTIADRPEAKDLQHPGAIPEEIITITMDLHAVAVVTKEVMEAMAAGPEADGVTPIPGMEAKVVATTTVVAP